MTALSKYCVNNPPQWLDSPPRVLLIHWGGNQLRGSERCLIASAEALHAAGCDLSLLRNDGCIDAALSGWVDQIEQFDAPELLIAGRHTTLPLASYLRSAHQLYRHTAAIAADLMFVSGGRPCQVAVPIARLRGLPVLCHLHHPSYARYLNAWLVKHATERLYPSLFTKEWVRAATGADGRVVYNAVFTNDHGGIEDTSVRHRYGIPDGAFVMGQIGALVHHKRPLLAIEVFERLAETHHDCFLFLIGDGPERERLLARRAVSPVGPRIFITGRVDTLEGFYKSFDVNVQLSVEEGFGLTVIEAATHGVPSIIADATGLRETIEDGVTGIKCRPDNVPAFADAIRGLIDDPIRRRRLGDNARRRAHHLFSRDRYAGQIVETVRGLLHG